MNRFIFKAMLPRCWLCHPYSFQGSSSCNLNVPRNRIQNYTPGDDQRHQEMLVRYMVHHTCYNFCLLQYLILTHQTSCSLITCMSFLNSISNFINLVLWPSSINSYLDAIFDIFFSIFFYTCNTKLKHMFR